MFAHALFCSVLVAWGLSAESAATVVRRCTVATATALFLAVPFWLAPFLWQSLVLGPTGLPVSFGDSFLSFAELVDRRHMRGAGFALPIAVGLAAILNYRWLSMRTWVLVAAFAATLALVSSTFRPVASHLSILAIALFAWRLVFPAAFLGLAALWGGWRLRSGNDFVLACITTLSLLSMMTVMAGGAPAGLALAAEPSSDDAFNRTYLTRKSVWGRNEFLPNYAALPQKCDVTTSEIQTTSFAELERGITARLTYIAAPSAPLGGVSYVVNGTPTLLSACDGSVMLGPVAVGSAVKAEAGTLSFFLCPHQSA